MNSGSVYFCLLLIKLKPTALLTSLNLSQQDTSSKRLPNYPEGSGPEQRAPSVLLLLETIKRKQRNSPSSDNYNTLNTLQLGVKFPFFGQRIFHPLTIICFTCV
ncbi:hypothetical protein ILYODFUR_003915 [Ilyodon furcidens]|uniref:Secreted protein n=1 Tax=Ilyodon furcidens TaxID=33524 RepID=A0ABV0TJS8_9TELE